MENSHCYYAVNMLFTRKGFVYKQKKTIETVKK